MAIETDLSPYASVAAAVRGIDLSAESDGDLAARARTLRARIASGADPASAIVPVFALAAEASRRRLGLRPYDEQLVAGAAMHRGRAVQVQTGEGKTLAAVFPACLDAMTGKGVHVLTANDYLARRDAEWMRPVYDALGVSVASIGERTDPAARRAAYLADVTYLTAREAGFDHLRDGLAVDAASCVQREPWAAIVDEADFLLVDEARVPLVIAGSTDADGPDVRQVDRLVRSFTRGREYDLDREGRRVSLRIEAHPLVEQAFGVEGIHEERGAAAFARVHAALHAHALLARDVDYVVKEGRVELVDAFTGRIADRRQWPWGIQAAIEAKESLEIRPEGRVFGTITIQHLVRRYRKLSAMTATAVRCAEELAGFYGLATVIVPTVEPVRRVDLPDLVFRTRAEKLEALVAEIAAAHATGRPVLVGTASVRESEELAAHLAAAGVACEVLNARNDEREAELVAGAGRFGAVTISTNMAGRGTDIRPDAGHSRWEACTSSAPTGTRAAGSTTSCAGEPGRQGEPGSSRFFVSLEDPLFERYGVREFLPRGLVEADGTGPLPGSAGGGRDRPGPAHHRGAEPHHPASPVPVRTSRGARPDQGPAAARRGAARGPASGRPRGGVPLARPQAARRAGLPLPSRLVLGRSPPVRRRGARGHRARALRGPGPRPRVHPPGRRRVRGRAGGGGAIGRRGMRAAPQRPRRSEPGAHGIAAAVQHLDLPGRRRAADPLQPRPRRREEHRLRGDRRRTARDRQRGAARVASVAKLSQAVQETRSACPGR